MSFDRMHVGRYAPSPTGDLHFGNLRTAMIAWLAARLQGGRFVLRMEDLDTPRVVKGSADRIISDLVWLGLDWDGPLIYQSLCVEYYQEALDKLQLKNLIYPCFCSRKDIQIAASAPHQSAVVYPRTCSELTPIQISEKHQTKSPALRIRVPNRTIVFEDICIGHQSQILDQEVGDFVIKRSDGLFAYQLAVVVDDLRQGITDVVRGSDLVESTARQIYLSSMLSSSQIQYWHVPLMTDRLGHRMAKRDGSLSAQLWRDKGRTAEELVGVLARSVGLIPESRAISLEELLSSLSIDTLEEKLRDNGGQATSTKIMARS